MCADWHRPNLDPDEEAALLKILESRLVEVDLESMPTDIVDRCRILSRIPLTEDELQGAPGSLWKKLGPLGQQLYLWGDIDPDSPEWQRTPAELEWNDYSPDAWTDVCERWRLALYQCLEGPRKGDLEALVDLSKAVAYAADCYELSSAPLHIFARHLESYSIGLRRIEDFVTDMGPSEEVAAARVVVDQVGNRAFQAVGARLRRAEDGARADDPEEALQAQETGPGDDSRIEIVEGRIRNSARVRVVLAALSNLDRYPSDNIPRTELEDKIGIPPTSVDRDFNAGHGDQPDKIQTKLGAGSVAYKKEYLVRFVLHRWSPREGSD